MDNATKQYLDGFLGNPQEDSDDPYRCNDLDFQKICANRAPRTPLGTSAAGSAGCFHFISFHFISFHFISFHFISFHFISFHFSPRAGRRGRGERQVHAG